MSDYSSLFGVTDSRYTTQIQRVKFEGRSSDSIETTIIEACDSLDTGTDSFVIYGEPQSGKTEMMICLVAKLLDLGYSTCVVLVNDSIDLLNQNIERFQRSGLSPTPQRLDSAVKSLTDYTKNECVVFCKKNSNNLKELIIRLKGIKQLAIIDDEADFATPNAKINKAEQTKINELVLKLKNLSKKNLWIGVTATPGRLDLNNTIENDRASWVRFPTHSEYCGHDVFFPSSLSEKIEWELVGLPDTHDQPKYLIEALSRFLVNVADLNCDLEILNHKNYAMIVHTSGTKLDHEKDRKIVENFFIEISDPSNVHFNSRFKFMDKFATEKYGSAKARKILEYIAQNCLKKEIAVINSNTDKGADIVKAATNPRVPFTIAIGGNIISRGVTFNNLLTMYFTRTTRTIQQDTYIQRARMFGSRKPYLDHFELHIQQSLYKAWHECFVLHRLAIASISSGRPVWPEIGNIRAVASSSVDQVHVLMDRREVEFDLINYTIELENLTSTSFSGFKKFHETISFVPKGYIARHLIDFIDAFKSEKSDCIVWHATSDIENFADADYEQITRAKGFFGQRDLEQKVYPNGIHHFKFYKNKLGKARLYYKYTEGRLRFVKWRD